MNEFEMRMVLEFLIQHKDTYIEEGCSGCSQCDGPTETHYKASFDGEYIKMTPETLYKLVYEMVYHGQLDRKTSNYYKQNDEDSALKLNRLL